MIFRLFVGMSSCINATFHPSGVEASQAASTTTITTTSQHASSIPRDSRPRSPSPSTGGTKSSASRRSSSAPAPQRPSTADAESTLTTPQLNLCWRRACEEFRVSLNITKSHGSYQAVQVRYQALKQQELSAKTKLRQLGSQPTSATTSSAAPKPQPPPSSSGTTVHTAVLPTSLLFIL